MKTFRLLIALLVLGASLPATRAADKPKVNYQALANRLAAEFLRGEKNTEDDLPGFLQAGEVTGDALAGAVKKAVAVGRAIIADGVAADSKYFAPLLADSTGGAAPASAGPGAAPAKPAPAATTKTDKPAAPKTAGETLDNAMKLVGPLRKYGFSLGAGFGTTIDDGRSAALTSLLVRYNLRQEEALTHWYKTKRDPAAPTLTDSELAKYVGYPTFTGPILGVAMGGEKLSFGTKMERPWLMGWSVGWGVGPEASSAIYLDLAATVSPTSGFAHSKPYVGISFDGVIAAELFKILGTPFSGGAAAPDK